KLDVAAAFDAQVPDDAQRGGPQHLVLLVREGLAWGHHDGVTRMKADGIDVFHAADSDRVVRAVPDHFKLDLFPARNAAIEEDLLHWAALETARGDFDQPLLVVGKAASAAAHGVRRPHDDGIPHLAGKSQRLFDAVNDRALRHGFADLFHGEFEKLAVFGRLDRRERRAEEPHPKAVQYPCLGQCHGQIEAGLAPQGGKQPIGPLAFDHFGGELEGEGFEVHFVGNMGIRHDGCRVGVDEDDLDPIFLQGFTRLSARVIKLRRLADDDRARPDHQHPLQLALSWHADAHSSHTSSSRRNASSISSSLTVSGGSKRSTLSPMTLTSNPFSRHPFKKRLPGTLSSTPSINPKPRTSPKTLGCRSAKPLSPCQRRWAAWG